MAMDHKELVDKLKVEWKRLWRERVDDKLKAEGIAINDYYSLFVDKGTIIHATRDFKALNFKDILKQYQIDNKERFIQPSPQVGGWNKFVKAKITNQNTQREKSEYMKKCSNTAYESKKANQQSKKGGRGWLHK